MKYKVLISTGSQDKNLFQHFGNRFFWKFRIAPFSYTVVLLVTKKFTSRYHVTREVPEA